MQAANADLVVICSYPLSSVGIVLAANELNFTPKMLGGAMVGLQSTVFKDKAQVQAQRHRQLRNLGAVTEIAGAGCGVLQDLSGARQGEGIDPLGYYLGGWGYAYFQLLGEAIEGAKTLNDEKLADYMHSHEFNDHHGPTSSSARSASGRRHASLQVQYHGITDAANLETWRGMSYQTVLTPADQKTGALIYPYAKAK